MSLAMLFISLRVLDIPLAHLHTFELFNRLELGRLIGHVHLFDSSRKPWSCNPQVSAVKILPP